MGHIQLNVRRLTLLGAFIGALLVVLGVGLQWGAPAALMAGGGLLAALCVGIDFQPERE